MSTQEDEQPGRVVGDRYRLSAQLGSGAMGTVWSGYDEVLRRKVAVKELKVPRGIPEREALAMRERMLREARALGGLSHPNVITVFDVVDVGGQPLVVLEMVPSRNLAAMITDQGPLDPRQAAVVGYATAAALRAAHRAGITHRDVKPGNILIAHDGRIKLTDFGIARNALDAPMTTAGLVLGSPAYIAPEVASGGAVTPAADLWGLGTTLFAAIEGRPPYDVKGDPVSTITEVVDGDVPHCRDAGPVSEVIAGLMVKEPAARMPLEEVRRRLRPLLDDPDDPLFPGSPDAPTLFSRVVPPSRPPAGERSARYDSVPEPRVAASGPVPPVAEERPAERSTRAPARGAPLAAAPGPLPGSPYATGAHPPTAPPRPPMRAPAPPRPAPPRPPLPASWALPLAVAGALLVLLGVVGGYVVTRAIAGQSPVSTVTVTTARTTTTPHADQLGWSIAVPSTWAQFRSGEGREATVRFVSPDGSEELAVWHTTGDVAASFTAEKLGVDSVAPATAANHFSIVFGAQQRTAAVQTVPVADGAWAISLTVPEQRAGSRADALLASLGATFTTPPAG
ncbi:serine/threonine-protein kinase [Pseudonocardia ailaonensis]|uniref:non-specific serine/threonine protein kinase n=1 Tax=Pseudonocardia ailaonensis TaxID=367279 RepID=A0ABN2NNQ1_9PSEU